MSKITVKSESLLRSRSGAGMTWFTKGLRRRRVRRENPLQGLPDLRRDGLGDPPGKADIRFADDLVNHYRGYAALAGDLALRDPSKFKFVLNACWCHGTAPS
jgi:hypothetical protein